MGKCWATLVIRGAGQLRRKMLRSQQCKQQHLLLLVSLSLLRTLSSLRCKRRNIAEQAFIWDFFLCVCAWVKISKKPDWFPRVRLKGMFAHKYFLIGTGTWKWFCYVRSISFIDAMKKVCLLISVGSCNSHLFWLGFLAAKLSPEFTCREHADCKALHGHCTLLWGPPSFSGRESYFYVFCVSATEHMAEKMLNLDAEEIKGRKIIYGTEE